MSTKDQDQFDFSLLDKTLDDIEDLAGFETPVPGVYTLKLKMETKVINNKPAVVANMEVIECQEQDDPEAEATKPDTKFSVAFFLNNEVGLGKLKEFLLQPAEFFGESNLKVLLTEHMKESLVCSATVKRKKNKEDPDKPYADVSNVVIL